MEQPTHALTLTTSRPDTTGEEWGRAKRLLLKDVRSRWGLWRTAEMMEWTTGTGARSGGHRRMHSHTLIKDVDEPSGGTDEIEDLVRWHWRRLLHAPVVEVARIRSVGGAIGYMGIHHLKPEQHPPPGWRGMRMRWSQGARRYLHRPVAEMRQAAADVLAEESIAWRIRRDHGDDLPFEMFSDLFDEALAARARDRDGEWRLERGSYTEGGLWLPQEFHGAGRR